MDRLPCVLCNVPLQGVLGGNLLLQMKTCMLSLQNSKGKSYHTLELHIAWLKELSCLKSTKAKLKPVHVLGNIFFLMSPYDLDKLCEWVRNKRSFLLIRILPLMGY